MAAEAQWLPIVADQLGAPSRSYGHAPPARCCVNAVAVMPAGKATPPPARCAFPGNGRMRKAGYTTISTAITTPRPANICPPTRSASTAACGPMPMYTTRWGGSIRMVWRDAPPAPATLLHAGQVARSPVLKVRSTHRISERALTPILHLELGDVS